MREPDAVVFDLDGTLTDTEVVWEQVRRNLAMENGHDYTVENTAAMMGMSTPEWASYCSEVLGYPGTLTEIADRVIDGVAQAYRERRVVLLPGAAEVVKRMAARGPVAVASSSPPVLIDAGLDALGVGDLVSVRVSSEQVNAGKPAPAVYLEACRQLGVDPRRTMGVEDSRAGIISAADAGMRVVAVPLEPHVPSPEVLARAHLVLSSLDELTVEVAEGLFRA